MGSGGFAVELSLYCIKHRESNIVQISTETANVAVQTLLSRWGQTRRIDDPYEIDYPHETPFSRLARTPGSWGIKAEPLSDEMHGLIDSVISQLKTRHGLRHEVIWRSYVYGDSDSQIARDISKRLPHKITRHEVKNWRWGAEGWIESRLDL
jgi:hypothetical protein